MHPNPVFRRVPENEALAFAAERGFGVVTAAHEGRILAAHVPFVLEERRVTAHLQRGNPLARALARGPLEALVIVPGADAYISPDWYGEPGHVPTWNYLAVHLRGMLSRLADEALRPHLERLSAEFEHRLALKPPWRLDKLEAEPLDRMMRMIVPVALEIESVEATFKLGQNRSPAARRAAARALTEAPGAGLGQEMVALGMAEVEDPEGAP